MKRLEPLIFEKSSAGRTGYSFSNGEGSLKTASELLDKSLLRDDIEGFPEVSEVDVVRHYTRLSQLNHGVDTGFYPLGSCTMKYNPKINEDMARLEGFAGCHPYMPEDRVQGSLELMYCLQESLKEIAGFEAVSLQPAAGAHGELLGMLLIRACLTDRGNPRKVVLIPDSAHGTNPSSASIAGYSTKEIKSNEKGMVSISDLKEHLNEDVAAMMVTNPNTLGVFEANIKQIADLLHENGSLLYCDGANLNALMGKHRPGDAGVDVLHMNLHKTFSTPHGGGGPGAGPVGVNSTLAPFLPVPVVAKKDGRFFLNYDIPKSIGRVRAFYGNFGILVRAMCYILSMGAEGLKKATETAVLNANYIRKELEGIYHLQYDTETLHEAIFSDKFLQEYHIATMDVAKRLMDYGFHPPTVYFPLIVKGAIMIEPTETEPLSEIDAFISAMKKIAEEAKTNPEKLHDAPLSTPIKRLDEVKAAKDSILRWVKED